MDFIINITIIVTNNYYEQFAESEYANTIQKVVMCYLTKDHCHLFSKN